MEVSMYEILTNSPFFNGLTAKEIKELLQTVNYKIVEYPAKEIYTLAGMPCKYADFILKGELISRMTGLSGKQVQIDRLKACVLIAPAFIFCQEQRYARKCRNRTAHYHHAHDAIGT